MLTLVQYPNQQIFIIIVLILEAPYKNCSRRHFIFLLLSFEENKAWFFLWILCLAEDSLETLSLFFLWQTMKKYLWISSAAVAIGALRVNLLMTHFVCSHPITGYICSSYNGAFQGIRTDFPKGRNTTARSCTCEPEIIIFHPLMPSRLLHPYKLGESIHSFRGVWFFPSEGPRYNDSVCYNRFCCKIEFAVIKKLNMGPSKAWITDIFEQFFYKSYVFCIC